MTPANQKSKVYFMWDFTGRTLGMLNGIEGAAAASLGIEGRGGMTAAVKEAWGDIVGRAQFGSVLIFDKSGKIEMMCGGDTTEFGDEFGQAATAVTEAAE
jgi:hypothetical protein